MNPPCEEISSFLVAAMAGDRAVSGCGAEVPGNGNAAALKGMGDAADAHDVERHVGNDAHIPNVTIADGESLVGWDAIRDKQKEWWNNRKTDVVYEIQGAPDVLELAPDVVVIQPFDHRRHFAAGCHVVALAACLMVDTGWLAFGRPV
jgi:hypothetical protein